MTAAAIGALAIGAGLIISPVRTWSNLLVDGFFVVSLALGGLVFLAIQQLSGATWSAGLRRIAEAIVAPLPAAAVMMLVLFFGRRSLYSWSDAPAGYLSTPFFFARMAGVLSMWLTCAWAFARASAGEDADRNPTHQQTLNRCSAVFLVVFALSFSLATVDWLLSIDPHWSSTIFAVYQFAGVLVQGTAAVTLAAVLLLAQGRMTTVINEHHLHDLGKMLLAFSSFWAYLWLSQYLLIWYTNLPDEISYYLVRTNRDWRWLFAVNLAINWAVPFAVLLSRSAKRSSTVLAIVSAILLLGRWLDLYLTVLPLTMPRPAIGILEAAIAIGYGAVTVSLIGSALARRPLIAVNDPRLAACMRHQQ
jgi:hypothetical protein